MLSADAKRHQKVLVFCNTVSSARAVEHYCREAGLTCCCYHGEMPILERRESMERFSAACDTEAEGAEGRRGRGREGLVQPGAPVSEGRGTGE